MSKERSPFSPGKPVPPELFVGREDQVRRLKRAIQQASVGSPQYVFITGERGIGKSSLAALARQMAEKEFGFVGVHALLGGAQDLGEVCRRLYESLVRQLPDKGLIDRAKKVFDRYIGGIDLFGLGIEFKKDDSARESLAQNFLPLLLALRESFAEVGRKGILLIADDLNGISKEAKFAHFIKSTVDQIAVGRERDFPWVFILVGVPERMDDLKAQQPSVDRIFQLVDLPAFDLKEAQAFFERAFASVNHSGTSEAFAFLAGLAGGSPVIWHELGDAVFWADDDEHIDDYDVVRGLKVAAENVGRKYLKGPLYDELKSDVYKNILAYIGKSLGMTITRSEVLKALPPREQKNFDNFVQKMRSLDVIRSGSKRGQYVFTNMLYSFYIKLQSKAESPASAQAAADASGKGPRQ